MNLSDIYNIFFELLQIAVDNRTSLSRAPSADEWEELYNTAKKQTLTGIAFAAIERLPQEQLPPPRRIRQWAVKANRIREKNTCISKETAKITEYFERNGFCCLVLKGQGNMYYYTNDLRGLRSPGDIDVWIWSNKKHDICSVVEFCQSIKKGEYIYYHNLDFPILKDTPVEVHYRPSWLFCPWHNKKLQQRFKDYKQKGDHIYYDGYKIPTTDFNVLFQLLHLYKHIFEEGVGLRQLLDYYMVLKENCTRSSSFTLPHSLKTFAGAVMYVLQKVFAPTTIEWMICEANEKAGKQLLNEIMLGGNFGQYDERFNWSKVTNGSMRYRGLPYAFARLRHNIHFLFYYPSEVLFEPLFRIYNKLWIWLKLWRFE